MKTLGLIGGISWVSTIDYYKYINQGVNAKLGSNNSARCIIYSLNFEDVIKNNNSGNLEATYTMVFEGCEHLKNSGAKGIVLCANTMHLFADRLEEKVKLPFIHIAKATADAIKAKGMKKVGLLGTKFTMEKDFFKNKLSEQHIEAIIPGDEEREFVHARIFDELGKGILKQETRTKYLSIIQSLVNKGAEGIILGCTEIPLLIKQGDCTTPLFDTTAIHAEAAVKFALCDNE